uniref:Uncharacterized protein n=1 Tax=Lygus hesperus TaxID=30085 RepID=A0A146LDX9_LYGHE
MAPLSMMSNVRGEHVRVCGAAAEATVARLVISSKLTTKLAASLRWISQILHQQATSQEYLSWYRGLDATVPALYTYVDPKSMLSVGRNGTFTQLSTVVDYLTSNTNAFALQVSGGSTDTVVPVLQKYITSTNFYHGSVHLVVKFDAISSATATPLRVLDIFPSTLGTPLLSQLECHPVIQNRVKLGIHATPSLHALYEDRTTIFLSLTWMDDSTVNGTVHCRYPFIKTV